ncbi:lytic transglycosylase domain-containing protein [Lishizhenia sp.]|uniref:lytic transglycosylase domain-containing protein n=1 Tax=Lishizhenia sp. TaxID=2497594 RepID=UPI00299DECD0|nr:transglycosylase SLT domain-containing protein [Lishizhenia sp.]MDX1444818.1 transglycosylase SLT domain-containing protein [Lishizhenia sp.]
MIKYCWSVFTTVFFAALSFGQVEDSLQRQQEIIEGEQFIATVNASLQEFYKEWANSENYDSIVASLGYVEGQVPEFDDSVYCQRLDDMNEMSPFHYACNPTVLSTLKYFTKNRRRFTSITLGRSKLYFDMYEEKLDKHNMPIELKYLSVIESGLRPQVKSRVGATGLWQFMYRTGKKYGLDQNSFIDERMDPEKATEAACLYLKRLYNAYDDWNMALAAYNAGPGNVNKAIRRSGGKTTYWEIRPYLPRETQAYVPNFIAMSYMMTYHVEHNIIPAEAKVYDFELDTVCLSQGVHMNIIDSLMDWSMEDIQFVNPIYKTSYIPKTTPQQCINIPVTKVNEWIAMEDSIYALDSAIYNLPIEEELAKLKSSTEDYHKVRSGENLWIIARNNGTTVARLKKLNPGINHDRLRIGQRIRIR